MADNFLGSGLKFPLEIDPQTGALVSASGEEKIRAAVRWPFSAPRSVNG